MKLLDIIIYRVHHAAAIVGGSSLILLTILFAASGTFTPEALPEFFTSRAQLLGTVSLLILIPAFMIVYLIVGQRRSMRFGHELFVAGICPREPNEWLRPIDARVPFTGIGLGLLYALVVNTPIQWLASFVVADAVTRSMVIGTAVLWTLVGLALSYRLHTALSFYKLGRTADLDLLDIRKIEPFAKNGADDVLAIALLLAFSTVQGLDAQFRLENYASSMLIAVPAAAFLFVLPMLTVHRRLVATRAETLAAINQQIAMTSRERTALAIGRLELLLQHRDRIGDTLTWPIDWRIYSRLAFYFVLPPIAWLGAAVVELGVDRFFGS